MKLSLELVAESLNPFGAKINLIREESFVFSGVQLLSLSMTELQEDILYICEPSLLFKLKRSLTGNICFVFRARPQKLERYQKQVNAIVLDEDVSTSDVANRLFNLFSTMNAYEVRLHTAVLQRSGYQPLFDIAREMFPGNITLMVDSAYNVVCSTDTHTDKNPVVAKILENGFYDKEHLDLMAIHGYYNQGDKFLNPQVSLPPNVCGSPLIVRSYHESGIFFAFITCYFFSGPPSLIEQALFKCLADALDEFFELTDYYEQVKPFHQQFITDLINHTNGNEEFYHDRCLRLHIPQQGEFRMGLIHIDPANALRASHFALQFKAWCNVPNYGVFQYGSDIIILFRNWQRNSEIENADLEKNWAALIETLQTSNAYMGCSLPFKHISGFSAAYRQAMSAASYGRTYAPNETAYFFSKYYIYALFDSYKAQAPLEDLFVSYLTDLSSTDRCGYSDIQVLYHYLCSERNISQTGKKIHMHRNSVIYRVQRITDALGVDLDDPDVRLRLLISFKILEFENSIALDTNAEKPPTSIAMIE